MVKALLDFPFAASVFMEKIGVLTVVAKSSSNWALAVLIFSLYDLTTLL